MATGGKKTNPVNSGERLGKVAQLFNLLGTDPKRNIDLILGQTRSIIEGYFSLYLHRDNKQGMPVIRAGANLPRDLANTLSPDSHLFKEPLFTESLFAEPLLTNHGKAPGTYCILPRTQVMSDPLGKKLGVKACLGTPVFFKRKVLGTLWLTDTQTRSFSPDDIHCIQTLAAALGLEEERLRVTALRDISQLKKTQKSLLEEKERYKVLNYIRDISRIKELEDKLKQSEKMELIGTMAGGVAHDLNNILSGLVSYPELLLMQIEKDNPLVEPISFIHDTGIKAAEIVQDLLTLTRRGIHQTCVLNLNQVIHDYYNSSAHHRLEKNLPEIYFNISLEPFLLNLNGAESHISKVVMNLVMNAAEAVQTSGQVSIETFNRYVDISMGKGDEIPEGEYVVLRVSDTGVGISPADIKRIFEPFYTKKKMGRSGSGLGLSVVWNAVKDLQGYIDVSSRKEKGTSFELYFKATRDKMENIADDFQVESFMGDAETILVIDDVKGQRKIAQGCLKMLGYTPFAVSSGEKAISFLKKHPMDLLVLDMKMEPGMDGLETYKEVLKIKPTQKAVIASGFSETKRVVEATRLGIGQYIKKPYTLQKFATALKKELAREN